MTPKFDFTIVTPSFNQDRYLAKTIDSIWRQRGDFTIQHIIADGGSTDMSWPIIQKYKSDLQLKKIRPLCRKLEVISWSRSDRGQTFALKRAFRQASGDIVSWLNSDDLWASPSTLNLVKMTLASKPIDVLLGNAAAINEKGRRLQYPIYSVNKISQGPIRLPMLRQIFRLPIFSQPATFFRFQSFKHLNLDTSLNYTMDWDLLIQALRQKLKFYKINRLIALERIHPEAKTTKNQQAMYKEMARLYRKHHLWHLEHLAVIKKIIVNKYSL